VVVSAAEDDFASIGVLADQRSEQSRLAGPVETDETGDLAAGDVGSDPF
jgi:hypothetical protein